MLVTETFHGYIETTQDVLLIFEGCRRGLLPRICRRLQERERKMIRSGSIFVFDERESGIKRWTDGRVWSPSRILGNFLIYRELDKKPSNNEKRLSASYQAESSRKSFDTNMDRNKERQLVGSLSDSYKFREDGLIKKTMSIIVNGVAQHLISYYDPNEVLEEKLRAPSSVPELASLEISPELLVKQNFRIPPMVEPTDDTRHRSMSVGSISYNLMYHPYTRTPSMDYDNIPPPTSSPSTPLNRYHHQRNASLPRFDPRHYTTDIRQRNYQIQQDSTPNLGRLLNPINNSSNTTTNQQDLLQQINQYNLPSTQQPQQEYLNYYDGRNNHPIMFQPPPPPPTQQQQQQQQDHIYTNLGQE